MERMPVLRKYCCQYLKRLGVIVGVDVYILRR